MGPEQSISHQRDISNKLISDEIKSSSKELPSNIKSELASLMKKIPDLTQSMEEGSNQSYTKELFQKKSRINQLLQKFKKVILEIKSSPILNSNSAADAGGGAATEAADVSSHLDQIKTIIDQLVLKSKQSYEAVLALKVIAKNIPEEGLLEEYLLERLKENKSDDTLKSVKRYFELKKTLASQTENTQSLIDDFKDSDRKDRLICELGHDINRSIKAEIYSLKINGVTKTFKPDQHVEFFKILLKQYSKTYDISVLNTFLEESQDRFSGEDEVRVSVIVELIKRLEQELPEAFDALILFYQGFQGESIGLIIANIHVGITTAYKGESVPIFPHNYKTLDITHIDHPLMDFNTQDSLKISGSYHKKISINQKIAVDLKSKKVFSSCNINRKNLSTKAHNATIKFDDFFLQAEKKYEKREDLEEIESRIESLTLNEENVNLLTTYCDDSEQEIRNIALNIVGKLIEKMVIKEKKYKHLDEKKESLWTSFINSFYAKQTSTMESVLIILKEVKREISKKKDSKVAVEKLEEAKNIFDENIILNQTSLLSQKLEQLKININDYDPTKKLKKSKLDTFKKEKQVLLDHITTLKTVESTLSKIDQAILNMQVIKDLARYQSKDEFLNLECQKFKNIMLTDFLNKFEKITLQEKCNIIEHDLTIPDEKSQSTTNKGTFLLELMRFNPSLRININHVSTEPLTAEESIDKGTIKRLKNYVFSTWDRANSKDKKQIDKKPIYSSLSDRWDIFNMLFCDSSARLVESLAPNIKDADPNSIVKQYVSIFDKMQTVSLKDISYIAQDVISLTEAIAEHLENNPQIMNQLIGQYYSLKSFQNKSVESIINGLVIPFIKDEIGKNSASLYSLIKLDDCLAINIKDYASSFLIKFGKVFDKEFIKHLDVLAENSELTRTMIEQLLVKKLKQESYVMDPIKDKTVLDEVINGVLAYCKDEYPDQNIPLVTIEDFGLYASIPILEGMIIDDDDAQNLMGIPEISYNGITIKATDQILATSGTKFIFKSTITYPDGVVKECVLKRTLRSDESDREILMNKQNLKGTYKLKDTFFINSTYGEQYSVIVQDLSPQVLDKMDQETFRSDWKNIMLQMAKGIQSIHSKGLAHMDINPSNFYTDDKDKVLLTDLETVCLKNSDKTVGTTQYFSPEKATRNEKDDSAIDNQTTDIFAFGLSCLELSMGCRNLGINVFEGAFDRIEPAPSLQLTKIQIHGKPLPTDLVTDLTRILKEKHIIDDLNQLSPLISDHDIISAFQSETIKSLLTSKLDTYSDDEEGELLSQIISEWNSSVDHFANKIDFIFNNYTNEIRDRILNALKRSAKFEGRDYFLKLLTALLDKEPQYRLTIDKLIVILEKID